jgi:putative phage-type endonuclease
MGDYEQTTYATREQWLEGRKGTIGASAGAAALGLNPWQSPFQLYLQMTEDSPPLQENAAMRAGRILEPAVAQFFQEDTGREVISPPGDGLTIYKNSDYPFLSSTPDRFQRMDGKKDDGLVELKTSTSFSKGDWEDGKVPVQYEAQINIQMATTGLSWGSLSVLFDGREHEYRDLVILPDDQMEVILKALEDFWKRVQDRNPPDPDHRDLDAVKALFPESDPEKVLTLTMEQALRMEALWMLKTDYAKEVKEAEKHQKDADAKLRMEMAGNEEAHAPDGTVYRLPTTRVEEKTVERPAYSFRKLYRRKPKA